VDERFIPLAAFVRGTAPASRPVPDPVPTASVPAVVEVARGDAGLAHAEIAHDLTLMRLAAFEAFEGAKHALLRSFAEAVLGRELALAPADVGALAKHVTRFNDLEPVSLVVSAADAERVRTALPTRVDPSLTAGDFVVEVRDGALESPRGFRFQAALARAWPAAT
jgi:hypothetical protein